jgi:hypothetical protein
MSEITLPQNDVAGLNQDLIIPREAYELSAEQLDDMEAALVANFKEKTGVETGVVCMLVAPDSEFANFGRTIESVMFKKVGEDYDFPEGMAPYEATSRFLYTVDVDLAKIAHTKRIVTAFSPEKRAQTGLTGLEAFDDRMTANVEDEHVELEDILSYHQVDNVEQVLNVATNNRTKRVEQTEEEFFERPYVLMSYKGTYELLESDGANFILAYVNRFAYDSLGGLGLEAEDLAGGEYHLPLTTETEQYDPKYQAIVLPANEHNRKAFSTVDPENPLTALIAEKVLPLYQLSADETAFTRLDQ